MNVSTRAATRLAWTISGLYLVLAGLDVALVLYGGSIEPPVPDLDDAWMDLVLSGALLVFVSAGAVVAARRPENPVGWVMCAFALAFQVGVIFDAAATIAAADPTHIPAPAVLASFSSWSIYPALMLGVVVLPLLFPDGHVFPHRWRPLLWLAALALLFMVAGEALRPGETDAGFENPFGVDGAEDVLAVVRGVGAGLFVLCVLGAFASLVLRFRHAGPVERQQLKWFALAAAPMGPAFALAAAHVPIAGDVGWYVGLFSLLVALPLAMTVAILRYRLYDIDLIIRRTLVYGTATVALAGVYLAVVLLFQQVFSSFAGGGDLAIAASTLVAFALFRPVRARVQALVDRRFYRERYDSQRILDTFAGHLREEVDLRDLTDELAATVDQTMRPAHVSVWLRGQET
jgi:hypothetical protein